MEAIAIYNRQDIAPAQEITAAMFNDFVAFIDRSEKTTKSYIKNFRQFLAWLKFTATTKPQREDIILYRQWLSAEHEAITFAPDTVAGWEYRTDRNGNPERITCKPTTIKAYLQSVKQFFSWTAANNIYPNIAANVHPPKLTKGHKKRGLTAPEVLTIENSIAAAAAAKVEAATDARKDTAGRVQRSTEQGKRMYAMYLLAVNTGLRTVEISRANIKDLERENGRTWLYIWGKGHSSADKRKPLAPEVAEAIADYLRCRSDLPTGNSPLFVSTGNRSKGQRIASTTISTMLKQAMVEAGFDSDRITAHSLRHSTARNVMEITGNNIYNAQLYMRHESPTTTEEYLENDTSAQDERIADSLYQHYHGQSRTGTAAEQLEGIISVMNPEKLEQLLLVAQAMQK